MTNANDGGEAAFELLNVYDEAGQIAGTRPRDEAKAAGLAVGAVNVLLVNARGEALLQRRPRGKENGGRWDKSVGGHVSAGEGFDDTARRECGEELFDDPRSPRVVLVGQEALAAECARRDLTQHAVLAPLARHLNLRDVRVSPDGAIRNVVYHVGIYVGRTDIAPDSFRPQASEIDELGYFSPGVVDTMLLRGQLAPNMAYLWLGYGRAALRLAVP